MTQAFDAHEITVETEIDAPPSEVWRALVQDTAAWWHEDYFIGGGPRKMIIEPRLGGRLYEDWGDGQGAVWATVTGVETEKWLLLSGELTKDFGGPARVLTQFRLAPEGSGTRLTLTDCVYGRAGKETAASLEGGWQLLLGDCLKGYVEHDERPPTPVAPVGNVP